MKRKISLILVLTMILVAVLQFSLLASDISLCNNNTVRTTSYFAISDTGNATVRQGYEGYSNVTTGATINITIEKRNLLLFWSDVVSETITVSGIRYSNELTYQLDDTGTYRCTVEYVVSGTGGADDVITFEDTKTYSN